MLKKKIMRVCSVFLVMLLLAGMSSMTVFADSGIIVEDSKTPQELVEALLGPGVTVSNITYAGTAASSGIFSGGEEIIGIEQGVVLSTGQAKDVVGPNELKSNSTGNGLSGDADLESLIPGYGTKDATVLEFDFVPETEYLTFQYVFGSEEYNEYVGSGYNDIFAFYVNGVNLALVPGTTDLVSVNTINNDTNSQYFRDNTLAEMDTEMDGITTMLTIEVKVNVGETNHMKLAIADTSDSSLDSNVFISNFRSELPSVKLEEPVEITVEETVGEVVFTVTRDIALGESSVDFVLADGTAVAPDDYTNVSGTILFADGELTKTITIPIIDNDTYQGARTFYMTLQNPVNATIVSPDQAKVTITEDEEKPVESTPSSSAPVVTENPPTGDNAPLLGIALILSLCVCFVFVTMKKKSYNK